MNDWCWDQYSDDLRATATCQENDSQYIVKWDSEIEYNITFCDVGNNLYTDAEEYADQNGSGDHGENANQNIEPFEDRNCNSSLDLAESTSLIDCPKSILLVGCVHTPKDVQPNELYAPPFGSHHVLPCPL